MEELLRTNDMVLISYIESMLNDAGIRHHVMDINMSVIEGSLGVLPRRIMVDSDQVSWARRIVKEADIDILSHLFWNKQWAAPIRMTSLMTLF
jgi:putative signal transducing protein